MADSDKHLPTEAELLECERYVKTSSFQYAEALRKLLKANKHLTVADLSARIGRSVEWIEEKLKVTEEIPLALEPLEIFWDNKSARLGIYELRAHPAAMLLKLRQMSGGDWLVNCLGEAAQISADLTDEQVKNAAIGWMLPILERLKGSLNALYSK